MENSRERVDLCTDERFNIFAQTVWIVFALCCAGPTGGDAGNGNMVSVLALVKKRAGVWSLRHVVKYELPLDAQQSATALPSPCNRQ